MTKNILLVEYAAPSIDAVKEALASPELNITTADEGKAAKKLLEKNRFDLVITAAMLPKFHGFNLSLHVSSHYPGTKTIIISGIYKGEDTRQKAINQYKADDFIEKPINPGAFRSRVLELLDITEKELQNETAMSTAKISLGDTTKIPIVKKIKEEKKKDLTSEDIFGDLIDKVERDPKYEISLGEETREKTGKGQVETIKNEEKPKKSVETNVPPGFKTVARKPDTEEFKRPERKKPDSLATQKFEIDINSLIKPQQKVKDEKKFKKIEDEINKKFEDTLSGLGLSNKKGKTGFVTPKTEVIHEPDVKKGEQKPEQPGALKQLKTERIEAPIEEIKKEEEVGNYEILGLIARGGMAEIYKAKKKGVKGFEKIIALKKILSAYGEDDKYIEMFVDEAKIAAELSHPNIVQIYDLGQKDDFYFIAMEYVLGKDLRLILRRLSELHRPFPEEIALHLILKVLAALNYAHSAKGGDGKPLEIVHRDISPPNILVSFDGNIKLTDFGVSKATTKMHQTVSGALKGKLLYMSPEQASSDSDIDYRSDLYSVGIILFELLTGKKLFMDSSDLLVLKKVQQGEIIRPKDIKKDIEPELEKIILKSLNKDKNMRYKNASDMMKDIETYLMNSYDRLPGPIHISHFLYAIFKEDIINEKIDIDLKQLPYEIKKISGKEQEVMEPVQAEAEVEDIPGMGIGRDDEDAFEPIIEIDLDQEKEEEPEMPAETPSGHEEVDLIAELEDIDNRKKKKYLLWIIILLAVGIAAVIFIMKYLSTAESEPRAKLTIPVTEPAGNTRTKEKELTGPDDTAGIDTPKELKDNEPAGTTAERKDDFQPSYPEQQGANTGTQRKAQKEKPGESADTGNKIPATATDIKPERIEIKKIQEDQEDEVKGDAKKPETLTGADQPPAEITPAAPVIREGQVIAASKVDSPPVPLSTPMPKLSPIMRRTLSGSQTVLVNFLIDHKGNVETVKLLKGSKTKKLDTLIKETIRGWKYKPAVKDNVKVKVWKTKSLTIKR